ncbi:MAG: molybdopterin-dependent oxidoreductase [Burkholderiales bacterium]|nr:molybdopterin-dependent oxidoreductase [Burkholderiales bacterium]
MPPDPVTMHGVPMKVTTARRTTTPAHELTTFQTPSGKLFVVYHMGVPAMDADAWRLTVGGLVDEPLALTLKQLRDLPRVDVRAFHECAGNPLKPALPVRRIGNVVWSGVRLGHVLGMAGVRSEAKYVWARGADSGIYARTGTHCDSYLKDLPLEKALRDEVLLATELNGEPLDEEHGAPVRLVVPGYYGTNSVKWLAAIELEQTRAAGFYTTRLYNDRTVEQGIERVRPVWAVAPHSVIVSPAPGQVLALKSQRIWGWAWGANEIRGVEISADHGTSWGAATVERREDYCWQRFEYGWMPPAAGRHELACRATDVAGVTQPARGARNETFHVKVRVEGS